MRDIFLADAHLRDPADPAYRRLLAFLAEQRGRTRTLYLLGDIFDFWIGARHTVYAPYVPVLQALRKLRASGCGLVFVEGNHDFNMGPYFTTTLGCRVLPDGGTVTIDGRQVYIAHGDLVNRQDRSYRCLRAVLRSPVVRGLSRVVHPDWSWGVYRCLNAVGKAGPSPKIERELPVAELRRHARARFAAGCEAVVTGHFHLPFHETTAEGTLLSLGGWLENGAYAVWENGRLSSARY